MKTRTRLKDIADHLQISTALVSGVLNNRPNVWASEETRERVFRAARDLQYQPSRAAQNLSRGRSNTVGLVYRRLQEQEYRLAYTGLVDVLSDSLQSEGYDLTVANFRTQDEVLSHLSKVAGERSNDAIVLWGRESDTEEQALLLEKLGVPFVVKGRYELNHPNWNQVDYDHEGMMERAFSHLVSLGHRRIAYLGFPWDDRFVQSLRLGFFRSANQQLGFQPEDCLIGEHEDAVPPIERTVDRWMNLPIDRAPTAFLIGAGNAAWQAVEVCLAKQGKILSLETGKYSAAGVASINFQLMFGQAMAFQGIEIDHLAKMVGAELIKAVLSSQDHEPVQRYLPKLSLANSLELQSKGIQFINRESKEDTQDFHPSPPNAFNARRNQ